MIHLCMKCKEVSLFYNCMLFMFYNSNNKPFISILTQAGSFCALCWSITEQLQHYFHLHPNKAY